MGGTEHELKCWPDYFAAIARGEKRFELRLNDRNYAVGDVLLEREWDPETEQYTGKEFRRRVLDANEARRFGGGLYRGWVVMSLEVVD